MCHLASWVEVETKTKKVVYFLDKDKLRGKKYNELKKYLDDRYDEDIIGHGAIRYYFEELIKGYGKDRECTNFNTPKNFPKEIVDSIKSGGFDCFFSYCLLGMLNIKGKKKYEKIIQPARNKFEEIMHLTIKNHKNIEQPAFKEYQEIQQSAWKQYNQIYHQPNWRQSPKIKQSALEQYKEIEQPAFKKYQEIRQSGWEKTKKIKQSASKKYKETIKTIFWAIFKDKKNRLKVWR